MAHLAHEHAAPLVRLVQPRVCGNCPAVDAVDHLLRATRWERLAQLFHHRRKPAIEADHQARRTFGLRRFVRLTERVQLLGRDHHRLLDEDVLAGRQRPRRKLGVGAVAGGDEHGVDGRIIEQRLKVGGAVVEPELFCLLLRVQARGRDQPDELRPVVGLHVRDEVQRRVVARPHEPDAQGVARHVSGSRLETDDVLLRLRYVVIQHDTDVRLIAVLDELVGIERVREVKPMRRERIDVELALGHEREDGLHVALLRPPHVVVRVVDPALLVRRVVAPRAVRHRDLDLQLLVVVGIARDVHPHGAHDDDLPLAPGDLASQLDGAVALRGGRNERVIGPAPPVNASTAAAGSSSDDTTPRSIPIFFANSTFDAFRSIPMTRQPFALRSWTVMRPIRPSPTTATYSPSCGRASRTPCSAMLATVLYAAASNETPSGMGATRFFGTKFTSAWLAYPAPAIATRSPTCTPRTSAPTCSTMPAAL